MSTPGDQRRDDSGGRSTSANDPKPNKDLETIILGEGDKAAEKLIEVAKRIGEQLAEMRFSTSQIRNIFGIVRAIEQRASEGQGDRLDTGAYRDLVLLKPKLAYQYGRATNSGKERKKDAMALLKDVLSEAIDLVEHDRARFTHLVEFFEAILAYHRAAEGAKR